MPGPLDNDEILFPCRPVKGISDAAHEEVVVGLLDVAPREIGLDRDGAHRLERHLHPERLVDQDRVLVDPLPLDLDEALAYGLDESDAPQPPAQRREQPQRHGRLAVVLLRRGDENAGG